MVSQFKAFSTLILVLIFFSFTVHGSPIPSPTGSQKMCNCGMMVSAKNTNNHKESTLHALVLAALEVVSLSEIKQIGLPCPNLRCSEKKPFHLLAQSNFAAHMISHMSEEIRGKVDRIIKQNDATGQKIYTPEHFKLDRASSLVKYVCSCGSSFDRKTPKQRHLESSVHALGTDGIKSGHLMMEDVQKNGAVPCPLCPEMFTFSVNGGTVNQHLQAHHSHDKLYHEVNDLIKYVLDHQDTPEYRNSRGIGIYSIGDNNPAVPGSSSSSGSQGQHAGYPGPNHPNYQYMAPAYTPPGNTRGGSSSSQLNSAGSGLTPFSYAQNAYHLEPPAGYGQGPASHHDVYPGMNTAYNPTSYGPSHLAPDPAAHSMNTGIAHGSNWNTASPAAYNPTSYGPSHLAPGPAAYSTNTWTGYGSSSMYQGGYTAPQNNQGNPGTWYGSSSTSQGGQTAHPNQESTPYQWGATLRGWQG